MIKFAKNHFYILIYTVTTKESILKSTLLVVVILGDTCKILTTSSLPKAHVIIMASIRIYFSLQIMWIISKDMDWLALKDRLYHIVCNINHLTVGWYSANQCLTVIYECTKVDFGQ